jgi:ferrous iron transport protein A
MAIVPLRKMTKGQKGTIHRVTASGELGRRIRDMGLVPGTPFSVQGRAPLLDPVAIRIRSFTLTLRNNESDYIEAEVEEGQS